MNNLIYKNATGSDQASIKKLLQECGLPYSDIAPAMLDFFIIAEDKGSLTGVTGLEIYSGIALLRSFAVRKEYRNCGIGNALYEKIIHIAQEKNINELYLLTTSAEDYFFKRGFIIINRNNVPDQIKTTAEFSELCPVTSVCMMKKISAGK
jgi:amino-acid N-acetyltransferase